jgi:inosine-uridine nucleoside N-ribohydrolase
MQIRVSAMAGDFDRALADPSWMCVALTACGGTVSGPQATRNLHYLTDPMDPLRHPRIGQAAFSEGRLAELPEGLPHPQALHGRFGLGDVEPLVPDLHNRRESARLIVDVVREHPGELPHFDFWPPDQCGDGVRTGS